MRAPSSVSHWLRRTALSVAGTACPVRSLRHRARAARLRMDYEGLTIADVRESHAGLARLIRDRVPAAIGKIGASEFQWIVAHDARQNDGRPYPDHLRRKVLTGPGLFPTDDIALDAAAKVYIKAIGALDQIAVWEKPGELALFARHCAPGVRLSTIGGMEPRWDLATWTPELAGRRVLVVSPFTASVARQYPKRLGIWARTPGMLPDFELLTLRCPLSPALAEPEDPDWLTACRRLEAAVKAARADVVLVGAGAYSLPLCATAKHAGAIGIHLGGALQILFGIKGMRWEAHANIAAYYTDDWARPLPEETPDSKDRVEGGCYW